MPLPEGLKKLVIKQEIQSFWSGRGPCIHKDLIYQWRKQMKKEGELAFPGNGKQLLTEEQKRIKDMEKRLKDTELERDILKKALAIFSQAQ